MARSNTCKIFVTFVLIAGFAGPSAAAVRDRVVGPVDAGQIRAVPGNLHRSAQPQFDRGAVDPGMRMDYMLLLIKPSAAEQAELDQLLADQQNPSSPRFHQWLTPEQFGARFGLSSSDHSKIVAWLSSEGFTVNETGRGRNWIAFSGTARQVSRALHTPIHRFEAGGETHFANTTEPSVPEALAEVAGGFLGLNDFRLKSFAQLVPPDYNSGTSHYLVPEDYGTIYDIAALYQSGIDGTGQSIAIVGESDVQISDIRTFRTRYNLPANDPKMILFGSDPGYNGAQLEGNLDLEWAGAIAPKATINYVYGSDALTAITVAVSLNVAPIISVSYGSCEVGWRPDYWRAIAQQGNAQGITILSASGDSGAGGCDAQGYLPVANLGRSVDFPAVLPEITGVGGTQFVEGGGTYWASSNSPNLGSALSYIPEAAWNESGGSGLFSGGGGASLFYSKPTWQNGPGVPADNARHVPDVSLSAAGHDAYMVTYSGSNVAVYGTSASAPSMAGIVALLNQYLVTNGLQKQPGLGNINPQLYRLAQSAPTAFHDVTAGDNIVRCAQGSPDCLTGSFGYAAAAAYDMASGLGSVDAMNFVTQWNTKTQGVAVTLTVNTAKATVNDTVAMTAGVAPAAGSGTPTGTVAFSAGGIALGTVTLTSRGGQQVADLTFPAYLLGTGTLSLVAAYSGDAAFSSGGTTKTLQIVVPSGAAAIVPSAPSTVWPSAGDPQGLSWQTTLSLSEVAGVAAILTGFTIDGIAQPLSQYFPSPAIPPSSTVHANVVFRNLTPPVIRTFGFTGLDTAGQTWSRQVSVNYFPVPPGEDFNLSATPLVVAQNTSADPSCQWSVQLNLDDLGGYLNLLSSLYAGSINTSLASVFGSTRLDAWAGLQGTLCFTGITPPASTSVQISLDGLNQQVTVSFAGPPATPGKVSTSPASVTLAPAVGGQTAQATLAVNLTDKTQPWTATVFPANRTTSWLTLSQLSGTGSAQVTLTASGAGFEPGAYKASIVLQSPNAVPQYVDVPVMFVLGGAASGAAITSIGNAATYQTTGSAGMLLAIFGKNLAGTTQTSSGNPLPFTSSGVSATVNGLAAPLVYISPTQINIQIPFEAGTGPAVLGIRNNGQVAGFQFQIAPAAPGIFADGSGNLVPIPAVKQGGTTTLYATGTGDVTPALKSGWTPFSGTSLSNLPKPVLPLSVTVGGVPAFVLYAGNSSGLIGALQVNFTVPASVPPGVQPLVLTVNGVSSPPVNITIQ